MVAPKIGCFPSTTVDPARSCLLFIDLQARLMPAIACSDVILFNARRLAEAAKIFNIPVMVTEENKAGLGETVDALAQFSDTVFPKKMFDATKESGWQQFLPHSRRDVVVAGCEAHVCVLQTVIGLLQAGHWVRVVRDAVGSRKDENREAGLQRAARFGADIVTTEMVIFEWLEGCDHTHFRNVLDLVK